MSQFRGLRGHLVQSLLVAVVIVAALWLPIKALAQSTGGENLGIVFQVRGQTVTLPDDVRVKVRDQADKIVRRCGYDGGDQNKQVWLEALAEPSSIRLVYAMPIELWISRRKVLVSQAVFSLRDDNFLGQPIVYHDGRTTLVFKCDGMDMLLLMCMPELEEYFPPSYQGNCHIVRQR